MNDNFSEEDRYNRAKKQVEAKMAFYIHATAFVCVNLLLIIINLVNFQEGIWFFWPLLGWGIGLAFHALSVYQRPKTSVFKEKMIHEEMKREE